jgi:amino acid adenylation domain-containing protein
MISTATASPKDNTALTSPTGVARPKKCPLSFAQQRLWFLDKLNPNSAAYSVPSVLRLKGPLQLDPFRKALNAVAARHESLRTTFESADDAPNQKVNPPAEVDLQLFDLSQLDQTGQRAECEKIISAEIRRPFNLATDLMIRAALVKLAPGEHILVLVAHHIASDEWSLGVLFSEWAAHYSSFTANRKAMLPELPMQYCEFAQRQREWLQSEGYQQQLDYWREQLKVPPVLDLPTDRPRPATQTSNGSLVSASIPRELLQKLKAFSGKERSTLFMSLLGIFKVLLHRYSQQTDIIVGCPIAGRNQIELEPLIGFFVNTLAIRSFPQGNLSFREYLKQVRESTLMAYANQDIPFDKLVEELHPRRSSSHMPFVQVMFSLQNEAVQDEIFPGVKSQEIAVHNGTSKFDLTFVAKETPAGLDVSIEYNTDLFEPERIRRMAVHFQKLTESVLTEADQAIGRLEMLSAEEKQQLIFEWNRTETDYPRGECVHQLFEAQAAKTPDAIAVQYGEQTINYRELNARANQLAWFLRNRKVRTNTVVGVYMERSIEMTVAFLAVLKAGAAYVPLDLGYPRERLMFMISDSAMALILTQETLRSQFSEIPIDLVCLDAEWPVIGAELRYLPPNIANPDSLAYIIYTSGSTGEPKGVAVPHRGITRLVLNTDYVRITAQDRIAQASNASFDAATFEIWGALLNGARLIGISKDVLLSPNNFRETLRAERITILFLTTALFNQLAREVPDIFGTLETLLFGGEAVDPKWVEAILQSQPPARLLHVYGPTENTTFSTWYQVLQIAEDGLTIPIGKPIANTQLYILDPVMQPVPIGINGEIYLAGDGLAHGYWKRPELSLERFIPNPFKPGTRLYRTGDLARFDERGNVEFVARIDHQVKLRGFRIELGEIEALLCRHPGIANSVVLLREDVPGDKRLAAYLIANEPRPSVSEITNSLRAQLPEYMIPSAFVFMEAFPLTPNEKIDRQALPAPEQNRPELNKTFIAPRDNVEQQLAKIWEKILGVQPIGVADNFFDLGGHSLLAVRVFSQIERIFNKKLPLATLFRAPVIEDIARLLREEPQAKAWSTIVDIQPKGSRQPFFWIHTLGGDGGGGFFYYRKLSELLGPDQPSFGIRSPEEPFSRIEDMARFYLKEIRKFQPEGPYFLGGFCFGGNVAFEMAQQLSTANQRVGLLVMLETSPPNVDHRLSWSAEAAKHSIENLVENVRDFVSHKPGAQFAFLKQKSRRLTQKFRNKIGQPAESSSSVELKEIIDLSTYPEGYVKYAEAHWHALTEYHPAPYPGEIILFRAKKQGLSNFNHTLGWDALVEDRVQVSVIPGTHENMLQEPNVQIVAAKLRTLLDHAQRPPAKTNTIREPQLVSAH